MTITVKNGKGRKDNPLPGRRSRVKNSLMILPFYSGNILKLISLFVKTAAKGMSILYMVCQVVGSCIEKFRNQIY